MKIGKYRIIETYECEEPQSCEYHNCKEDINGLNHLCIFPFNGFCFDIWLCNKHLKLFKDKMNKNQQE